MGIGYREESKKCSKCKKSAINLISITDDGRGRKYCLKCKRRIKAELIEKYPNLDFSKIHRLKLCLKKAKSLNTS